MGCRCGVWEAMAGTIGMGCGRQWQAPAAAHLLDLLAALARRLLLPRDRNGVFGTDQAIHLIAHPIPSVAHAFPAVFRPPGLRAML